MKTSKYLVFLFLVIIATLGLSAGTAAAHPLDYGKDASWSYLPTQPAKAFDVFFVHPSTYDTKKYGLIAPITDKKIKKRSDDAVAAQASVFKDKCNIYAPRYRQMSIAALGMSEVERASYLAVVESDVLAAFEYYLKHYNNGRPYFLASHSQGSNVLLFLLKKHRDLVRNDQLVAAYLIGWTFTDDDLKEIRLPLAITPTQLGGLITWNTIGKGGKSPTLLPGANCVNPLIWTNTTKDQPASLNLGAVIGLNDGTIAKIEHFTSARINQDGGLEIPTPSIEDKLDMGMGKANYHRYDYAFFYRNLVENVGVRCQAWLNMH
jgi:hypothetical protein